MTTKGRESGVLCPWVHSCLLLAHRHTLTLWKDFPFLNCLHILFSTLSPWFDFCPRTQEPGHFSGSLVTQISALTESSTFCFCPFETAALQVSTSPPTMLRMLKQINRTKQTKTDLSIFEKQLSNFLGFETLF